MVVIAAMHQVISHIYKCCATVSLKRVACCYKGINLSGGVVVAGEKSADVCYSKYMHDLYSMSPADNVEALEINK